MISGIMAMEEGTFTKADETGMEIKVRMIGKTIMTIMITMITEDKEKTNNQIDKFCPD